MIKQLLPTSSALDSLLLVQERFKKESLILENPGKQSNGMILVPKRSTPQTSSAPAKVSPDVAVIKHYQLIQNQQLDQSWKDLYTSFQGSILTKGFQEYKT